MHSSDKQLRSLLCDDESSQELGPIALHVETCERCQNRLGQLTGVGNWTTELVQTLREDETLRDDSSSEESHDTQRLTLVLDQVADLDEADIEFDPIPLDFLGPSSHPELLGRLGRYEIERVIGAGGMGLVLKGFDAELHRPVAIKVLAPHLAHSAAARKRFAREAQATAAVIHPHVIPIHNVESGDKLPYLVMSYINGSSLQWYVDTNGPLNVEETLRIAMQTAAGMRAAHEQGLIHRDVKPANILLEEGTLRVVLSDFGLARTMDDASLTRTGIVTGTPHYMSPEQAGGDAIDARSDLFSLGCVIYFMLTGRPPFRAATAMGVLNRICHETHRPVREVNASVPVPLAKVIDRLLSKQAGERYATAEDLEQALSEIMRALKAGKLKLASHGSPSRILDGAVAFARKWHKELAAAVLGIGILQIISMWQPTVHIPSSGGSLAPGISPPLNAISPPLPVDAWQRSLDDLQKEFAAAERPDDSNSTMQWLLNIESQAKDELDQLEADLNHELQTLEQLKPQ